MKVVDLEEALTRINLHAGTPGELMTSVASTLTQVLAALNHEELRSSTLGALAQITIISTAIAQTLAESKCEWSKATLLLKVRDIYKSIDLQLKEEGSL